MRRDIGSELIVALLAAVALVIAAIFAVLLATSTRNPPQPTESPTAAFTESAVPPLGTTPEATAVAAVDTATPRVSFTESPTEPIGITPSVAATSTHTQTATAAIEQTASETPSPPVNVTESIPTRTAAPPANFRSSPVAYSHGSDWRGDNNGDAADRTSDRDCWRDTGSSRPADGNNRFAVHNDRRGKCNIFGHGPSRYCGDGHAAGYRPRKLCISFQIRAQRHGVCNVR